MAEPVSEATRATRATAMEGERRRRDMRAILAYRDPTSNRSVSALEQAAHVVENLHAALDPGAAHAPAVLVPRGLDGVDAPAHGAMPAARTLAAVGAGV